MGQYREHIGRGSVNIPRRQSEAFYRADKAIVDSKMKCVMRKVTPRAMRMALMGDPSEMPTLEDSDGDHTHVCGFDTEYHARQGCGHVWRHNGKVTQTGSEHDFEIAHTCPACGRGLWKWKLAPNNPAVLEGDDNA